LISGFNEFAEKHVDKVASRTLALTKSGPSALVLSQNYKATGKCDACHAFFKAGSENIEAKVGHVLLYDCSLFCVVHLHAPFSIRLTLDAGLF